MCAPLASPAKERRFIRLYESQGLSRSDFCKHLLEALDASLRRLRTDYLDLYLAHASDAETPIEETLQALDDVRHAGKIRYAGTSNYPAWRLVEGPWMSEVQHTLRLDYLEPHYNLVHRVEFEHDVQTICQQYQIAVLPYSPLTNGFLTGKYSRGQVQAAESARAASVRHRYDREEAWHARCRRARLAARPAGCDRTPSRSPFRPTALSLPGSAHGDIDDRLVH